jgi:hypothetical protein
MKYLCKILNSRLAKIVSENIPQIRKKLNDHPAIALSLSSLDVIPMMKVTVDVYPFDRENRAKYYSKFPGKS